MGVNGLRGWLKKISGFKLVYNTELSCIFTRIKKPRRQKKYALSTNK